MPRVIRHHTQLAILDQLRLAKSGLRYRDMKPPSIESDLYNYHLQILVKQGYVTKTKELYHLEATAKKYLIEFGDLNRGMEYSNFKMASLCVVFRGGTGAPELLYQTRGRQPMAGQQGLVGGGIRRGEQAIVAAGRVLKQKAGLQGDFRLLGLMRKLRFDSHDQLYMDILYHVCVCTKATGVLLDKNDFGEQYWVPLNEAIRIEREETMGSSQLAEVLAQFKTIPPTGLPLFYIEEVYHHDIF